MQEFTKMFHLSIIDQEGPELDIIRQLFREYEKELGEDLCFQSFEAELKDPLKKYGEPKGTLILAYWNNEIAGCIALTEIPATNNSTGKSVPKHELLGRENFICEMKRLYVRPQFRKNKIGQRLVEQLIQSAKTKGYKIMKLDTLQRLKPAIQLYERFGFVHTIPYNTNPISDVVYMEKNL